MPTQEEQLIEQGDSAEVLLSTPAFSQVIDETVQATFATFCNSDANKKEERELAHNHYRAIVDVVNTLKQRVQVRDSIIEQQTESDNRKEEEAP